MADEYFAQLVTERSGGKIKVEVYPGSQLGEEKAAIEQVQLGALAFTRVSSGPMAEFNKALGAFSLPYIFDNADHMWKYLNGPDGQKLLDGLAASRFIGLAYYDPGARSFYNRERPIKTIDDLKGLKFRVFQSVVFVDMVGALGADAVPMPYGEVYSSIETGVIDGAENNFPSYESSGHYEVAKHYTLDEHTMVPEVLVMSKTSWDKLTPEDQELVRQAAKDSVPFNREKWAEREKQSEEKVRAAGVEIIEEIDKEPFIAAMAPIYEKYANTPELQSLVERIQAVE
jgi:tripartite ATP-independent transporter DctP family solute receptor